MSTKMNEFVEELELRDDFRSDAHIDLVNSLRDILEEINAKRDDDVTRELLNYTVILETEDDIKSVCNVIRNDLNKIREYDDEDIIELSYDAENVLDLIDCDNLNEALPADLAKAFKNATKVSRERIDQLGYGNINDEVSIDFENSDYSEISKDDALRAIDDGNISDLRIIFDNQLVAYGPNKNQIYKATPSNWRTKDLYKHLGSNVNSTRMMTPQEIIDGAEKIYFADEASIDTEERARRRERPESKFSDDPAAAKLHDYEKVSYDYDYAKNRYKRALSAYKDAIDAAFKYLDKYGKTNPTLETRAQIAKKDLDKASNSYARERGKKADAAIKVRDYTANKDISANVNRFGELKRDLYYQNDELERANRRLDRIKTSGSIFNEIDRNRLKKIEDELKRLNDEKLDLEKKLEHADEQDERDQQEAEIKIDRLSTDIANTKFEIDNLLHRKTESLTEAEDDKDISILDRIERAGKLDEFNDFIKEVYPEGLTDEQINDILTYESDFILSHLGMED